MATIIPFPDRKREIQTCADAWEEYRLIALDWANDPTSLKCAAMACAHARFLRLFHRECAA